MQELANLCTVLALLLSLFFFVAGSVGLVRMPDTLTEFIRSQRPTTSRSAFSSSLSFRRSAASWAPPR